MSLLYHLLSSSFSEAISEGHGPTDVSLLATSALHKVAAPGPISLLLWFPVQPHKQLYQHS